jgi:hypothetical protein
MRNNPTAPAIIAPCVQITAFVTNSTTGDLEEVSFFYDAATPTGSSPALLAQLLDSFVILVIPSILACLPPTASIPRCIASDLNPGVSPTQIQALTGAVGTAGATALPSTVAAVLTRYTGLKGQHGRGRLYMPCVPNTFVTPAVDPNSLNGAAVTAYDALQAAMIVALTDGVTPHRAVVVTRALKPATVPSFAAAISSVVLETTLGTVRRRRKGRGQ